MALGALGLLVAIVAVLGTWQVLAARSSQQRELENGQAAEAHLASSALASALASRLELVANLADQPELPQVFLTGKRPEFSELAATLHLLYPDFASFDVISAAGRLEGRWPADPAIMGRDLATNSSFVAVVHSRRPYISPATQQNAPPHELVVGLAAPVVSSKGKVVGVLEGTLATSTISSVMGGMSLGDGTQLVVVDQAGHALSGPGAGASRSFTAMSLVARALAGGSGSGTGDVPGYPGDRLVGYAPVPSTGWAVLAEASPATIGSRLGGLTNRLVAIGLVVVVIAMGTALLVGLLLRRLTREHEQTGAVLSSVGEGVATLGPDGRPLRVNPALELLGGRPAAALVGHDWAEAVPLYDRHGDPISWQRSIAAQAVRERRVVSSSGYDLHLGRSDGRRVPVAMTAAPLVVAERLAGAVVVLRDVSHEREVDQLKSSLVSTVSHELRTPLTMIQGFSELLLTRDDLGPDRSRDALEQVHSSSRRLGRLIDDLLSVSRIESGKLTVELAPVELGAVIADVVASFEAQTGRRFVLDVDPGLSPVQADADKIVQVVTNLVSNAVKYSPETSAVEIGASLVGDHAELSVTDQGIGMTDQDRSRLFEKFARADRPEVRKAGGTGLGLYITKSLVELQHGQMGPQCTRWRQHLFGLAPPRRGAGSPRR